MQISGFAPYSKRKEYVCDYHFSRSFRCWGWGTWRRAWHYFSMSMDGCSDKEIRGILKAYFPDQATFRIWYKKYCQFRTGGLEHWNVQRNRAYWDFYWNMVCYAQNGLCLVPEKNLIHNIGFDEDATHTQETSPVFANQETNSLEFPLRHPLFVYADEGPEQGLAKKYYHALPLKNRLALVMRHFIGVLETYYETKLW